MHPFSVLAPEYTSLLAVMRLDPRRERELAARAAEVLDLAHAHRDEWAEIEARTGVPRLWGLASFERESGSDYSRSPAQGDRWDRVSVHVPAGLGPYRCWGDACVAAYRIDRLDEVAGDSCATVGATLGATLVVAPLLGPTVGQSGAATRAAPTEATPSVIHPPPSAWTWPRACYEGELFNGFGPRAHGRHTGYLWSWTNIYTGGKYVADGKWDPDVQDQQCGMAPMMAALLRLDRTLALADAPPWAGSAGPEPLPKGSPAPSPPSPAIPGTSPGRGGGAGAAPALPGPPAMPALFGADATAWLQAALNRWGAAERLSKHEGFSNDLPLIVDGCYGRHTRRAVAAFQAAHGLVPDGLAGPLTLAALRGLAP